MEKQKITITVKVDDSCDMAVVSDDLGYVYCGNFWDFHDGCYKHNSEINNFNTYSQLANRLKEKHERNGYKVAIVKQSYSYYEDLTKK